MLKRYCVTYVGNDSHNHRETVWARNHDEAVAKLKAKDVDMIASVRRLSNPLYVLGVILVVIVLAVIELVR